MPKKSKAESYIGFCIKAGKLTCGFNAVELLKKDVFLLLLCDTVSDNGKKSAEKLQRRFGCETLLFSGKTLEEATGKTGCKLAAVREKNLAKAILSVEDENIRKYSGGNI